MLFVRCPVGVVERRMMSLLMLRMVSLVLQPSSTIMTAKGNFRGHATLTIGFPIKGDFATCFVEKYLAPCVAQDGNREKIVDKAGESMS